MTTAQLWFLRILALQLITNIIQKLHIALLRILLQRRDERPRHRSCGLTPNLRVLGSLRILTARPHNDVRRRSLSLFIALISSVAGCGFLEETHGRRCHFSDIATSVRGDDTEETLTGFFGEVGLFEDALGGVDVWEIEGRAGVAGIEDGG